MKYSNTIIEKCPDTGLYVAYIPDFPGAHAQAETLEDAIDNLDEVIEMLVQNNKNNAVGF